MDAVSEHSFTIDLSGEEPLKPLPSQIRRTKDKMYVVPQTYPKYEVEFYDTLGECAERIDKISDLQIRNKFNREMTKIFAFRNKSDIMRLYRDIVNTQTIKGQVN